MRVELINYTPAPAQTCGLAAAVCTNSSNYENSLRHSVESGHTSVLEHAVFTFKIYDISRVTLAQLTRHRLASFDVQSQRYVDLTGQTFIIPKTIEDSEYSSKVLEFMNKAINLYDNMVNNGIPCEDARYIIPQAVTTELVMTANARELLHFFSLRICSRAQWEIQELAIEMRRLCVNVAPEIFANSGPACITGKCPEKRPCKSGPPVLTV